MNPRTKRNLLLIAVLALLVTAVTLWAKTPRTFDQAMGSGFDRDRVDQIHAFVCTISGTETREVVLNPDDPACEELWAILDGQGYYPALEKINGQQMKLEHYVYLSCRVQEDGVVFPWRVDIPGSRYMQFLGMNRDRHFSPSGGLEFQQDVIDLLLAQPCTLS